MNGDGVSQEKFSLVGEGTKSKAKQLAVRGDGVSQGRFGAEREGAEPKVRLLVGRRGSVSEQRGLVRSERVQNQRRGLL